MSRSEAHDQRNALFRSTLSSVENAKSGAIPVGTTLEGRAKVLNLEYKVEDVPNSDGARLHFLGDLRAEKVVLYFHGGGFSLPMFDGHAIFLAQCAEKWRSAGKNAVMAFLEYGLTPSKKYPTQYMQGTEALRLLLAKGYKESNIIVGGDSAGGNLALALMSIILHPHPGIQPLHLQEPLAGLLLISPWISFESNTPSFATNVTKDMHNPAVMHDMATDFALPQERNNYTEAVRADASWWRNLPAKSTLNVFGGYEMFRDDDANLGVTLAEAGANVESVECPLQVHIDCILDAQSNLDIGPMSTAIWEWFSRVL